MENRTLKPYLLILVLMALTSLALAFTVDVKLTDEAGIDLRLPDQVDSWTGSEMRFCHNPSCQKEWLAADMEDPALCPECGHATSGMSLSEYNLLPRDTEIVKKRYLRRGSTDAIFASIVLSGLERGSIHRPEVCLVGQGRQITGSHRISVPIDGREPLDVMVLDLRYQPPISAGPRPEVESYYAYWFVGKDRETASHLERMTWMAWDRIVRNVSHRWAYISLGGGRNGSSRTHEDQIRAFLPDFYRQIIASDELRPRS